MLKRCLLSAALLVGVSAPAFAQSSKVEASLIFGWTFSDGVSASSPVLVPDGNIYDRIDPKDSGSWGFNVGYYVTPHAEVGFMYAHQFSKLVAGGTRDLELGDLGINSYHGYFGYNFFPADGPVVPFIYGGLGATNFSSVDVAVTPVVNPNGTRTIAGETQFSTTWGGGVKFFPSPKVGVRVVASWTPTYIKSDAAGWWCDPFWGCYLVGNAQYANQVTFGGGVTLRF
ncbi:MAG TPA: outer membrane beta-barrel protein [Vicinamibacterales bacterium]|jgi:opacity protein-like surface antigen